MNHAIRITLPFVDCRDVISSWADRCSDIIVYQHEADEEVSKTHVHLAIYGCEVKAEQLKRMWTNPPDKGNRFWSWKPLDSLPTVWESDTTVKYITYMSKGVLQPVFERLKNISPDIVERSRQAWVEPVKADKPGDHSDRLITQVVDHFKNETFKTVYHIRDMDPEDIPIVTIHTQVRKYTFRKLWGEHRKVPHASFFKIVADSAFMRICERLDRFDEGMSVVLNLAP